MLKGKIKIEKDAKIILAVLIVYLVVMLIIFLPEYIRMKHEKIYIVTNQYKIKYTNGRWKRIDNLEEFNSKEYEVYNSVGYYGKYKLLYNDHIVLMNDDKTKVRTFLNI